MLIILSAVFNLFCGFLIVTKDPLYLYYLICIAEGIEWPGVYFCHCNKVDIHFALSVLCHTNCSLI